MTKKYAYVMAVAVFFGALLQGCATSYSSPGMRARVVDAETKRPMGGVTVVAHWGLVYPLLLHGHGRNDMEILEAVTDDDGWFQFPAWGPRAIPAEVPSRARMSSADPGLIFFKSGYSKYLANEDRDQMERPAANRRSSWDGKTIELKKITGSRFSYGETIAGLLSRLNYRPCIWKKMPRMLIALDQEAQRLDSEGVPNYVNRLRKYDGLETEAGCGSPAAFFSGYKK